MRNPYLNALGAAVYIGAVGVFMHFMQAYHSNEPDAWYSGIAVISLLTLSVAVMGYFFAFVPLQMYLDGEKRAAVRFFTRTLLTFAAFTIVLLIAVATR